VIARHTVAHGLFFGLVFVGSLLLIMRLFSPRIWGLSDYPQRLQRKVPPQTRREKRMALALFVPWGAFVLGFPLWSTLALKARLGGSISWAIAALNILVQMLVANLGDWLILDWWIITQLTPHFVVLPGTDKAEYRDFSEHWHGHLRALPLLVVLCVGLAAIVARP